MKVTLKDVARKSGLSVTTVSRALNDFDDVAEATKAAVLAAADELGYSPNLNARRLKMQRADAIGFILPSENLRFTDPFFSALFAGVIERCAQHGFELNVTTPTSSNDTLSLYRKYLRSGRVDGFIVVRTQRNDARIRLLREHNTPFVAFGRTLGIVDYAYVDEDGAYGIQQALDHLVALGHRRIGYIGEPKTLYKSEQRLRGFMSGMQSHGLPIEPELIYTGNFRQRSGRIGAQQLLDLSPPPTAIVTANDLMALGAMQAAHERGLRVGKDLSITGFDDILLAELVTPALTTLHQPAGKFGALLCESLIDLITGAVSDPPQTVLQPSLVVRESTGPVISR